MLPACPQRAEGNLQLDALTAQRLAGTKIKSNKYSGNDETLYSITIEIAIHLSISTAVTFR